MGEGDLSSLFARLQDSQTDLQCRHTPTSIMKNRSIIKHCLTELFEFGLAASFSLRQRYLFFPLFPTILKAKLPLMAEWKKLGVPAIFTHPKNMGITLRTQVFGIGYNRELIPDKVAEKFTWETCADPKWLGQTTMDDRPRHLAILYQEDGWGAEKTIDYAKRWKVNKPIMEATQFV